MYRYSVDIRNKFELQVVKSHIGLQLRLSLEPMSSVQILLTFGNFQFNDLQKTIFLLFKFASVRIIVFTVTVCLKTGLGY